jgi:hypothetical protein
MKKYLSDEEVHSLNEKHGWFQHGDAQSDVSKAFAHDCIVQYEQIQFAAPDMLEALRKIVSLNNLEENEWDAVERVIPEIMAIASHAIYQATGE